MKILRLPAVMTKTGLGHSSIYTGIAKGTFSRPVSLGDQAVGWPENEIDDWIAKKIAERDAKYPKKT
jgi:prophage regulatory protein